MKLVHEGPQDLKPTAGSVGRVYTFYSYKGGVGRSMALANVAWLLSEWGSKVLVVDWDLEAPGLDRFFSESGKLVGDRREIPGVLDVLTALREGRHVDWRDCLMKVDVPGQLHFISAGRRTDSYRADVQNLDWKQLFTERSLGNHVNALRTEWRAAYDVVLIDSRTGITDIGDICTVLLPDAVVLLLVANNQNIEGISDCMARAAQAHSKLPVDRNRLIGVPVLGRDESYNEHDKTQYWRNMIADRLSALYASWLPRGVSAQAAIAKLSIPYVTNWSFGECLPVLTEEGGMQRPNSISAAYGRLARLLQSGLDWRALEATVEPHELSSVRKEKELADQAVVAARWVAVFSTAMLAVVACGVAVPVSRWGLESFPLSSVLNTSLSKLVHQFVALPIGFGLGILLLFKSWRRMASSIGPALSSLPQGTGGFGDVGRRDEQTTSFQSFWIVWAAGGSVNTVLGSLVVDSVGPGALIWMTILMPPFMALSYAQTFLAVKTRVRSSVGPLGGPMVYSNSSAPGAGMGFWSMLWCLCVFGSLLESSVYLRSSYVPSVVAGMLDSSGWGNLIACAVVAIATSFTFRLSARKTGMVVCYLAVTGLLVHCFAMAFVVSKTGGWWSGVQGIWADAASLRAVTGGGLLGTMAAVTSRALYMSCCTGEGAVASATVGGRSPSQVAGLMMLQGPTSLFLLWLTTMAIVANGGGNMGSGASPDSVARLLTAQGLEAVAYVTWSLLMVAFLVSTYFVAKRVAVFAFRAKGPAVLLGAILASAAAILLPDAQVFVEDFAWMLASVAFLVAVAAVFKGRAVLHEPSARDEPAQDRS